MTDDIQYEGDPRLTPGQNGGSLVSTNGQPDLDQGLENAVFLSISCVSGWWANSIVSTGEQCVSEVENVLNSGPLTNQLLLDLEEVIRGCLDWIIEERIAENIEVEATLRTYNSVDLLISIQKPIINLDLAFKILWDKEESRFVLS